MQPAGQVQRRRANCPRLKDMLLLRVSVQNMEVLIIRPTSSVAPRAAAHCVAPEIVGKLQLVLMVVAVSILTALAMTLLGHLACWSSSRAIDAQCMEASCTRECKSVVLRHAGSCVVPHHVPTVSEERQPVVNKPQAFPNVRLQVWHLA